MSSHRAFSTTGPSLLIARASHAVGDTPIIGDIRISREGAGSDGFSSVSSAYLVTSAPPLE